MSTSEPPHGGRAPLDVSILRVGKGDNKENMEIDGGAREFRGTRAATEGGGFSIFDFRFSTGSGPFFAAWHKAGHHAGNLLDWRPPGAMLS